MYEGLISTTYDTARMSYTEEIINTNSARMVITYRDVNRKLGACCDNSDIIVLYDIADKLPIIIIERVFYGTIDLSGDFEKRLIEEMSKHNYTAHINISTVFCDITMMRSSTYDILKQDV